MLSFLVKGENITLLVLSHNELTKILLTDDPEEGKFFKVVNFSDETLSPKASLKCFHIRFLDSAKELNADLSIL